MVIKKIFLDSEENTRDPGTLGLGVLPIISPGFFFEFAKVFLTFVLKGNTIFVLNPRFCAEN